MTAHWSLSPGLAPGHSYDERLLEHQPVALVLLGMQTPDIDGWAFVREYRARTSTPAPIVVVSAARGAASWAPELGAVECLANPFKLDDLPGPRRAAASSLSPRDGQTH